MCGRPPATGGGPRGSVFSAYHTNTNLSSDFLKNFYKFFSPETLTAPRRRCYNKYVKRGKEKWWKWLGNLQNRWWITSLALLSVQTVEYLRKGWVMNRWKWFRPMPAKPSTESVLNGKNWQGKNGISWNLKIILLWLDNKKISVIINM